MFRGGRAEVVRNWKICTPLNKKDTGCECWEGGEGEQKLLDLIHKYFMSVKIYSIKKNFTNSIGVHCTMYNVQCTMYNVQCTSLRTKKCGKL